MSAKTNLWVDTAILVAFLVAFEPVLTGIAIHEWLSLALAATVIIHLLLHWDWIIKVGVQFFRKLFHSSRLNFVINLVLFAAYILVMLSGILISRSVLSVLGIQIEATPAWRSLHSWSADLSLIFTGLHFALHWKWIVNTIKRYVAQPIGSLFTVRKLQPAAAKSTIKEN